jgi:hypothetical protein
LQFLIYENLKAADRIWFSVTDWPQIKPPMRDGSPSATEVQIPYLRLLPLHGNVPA